jgi:hypothetical protein
MTMRMKLWVGLMTIAVAAPIGAHAENQASFRDGIRPVDTYQRRDFQASAVAPAVPKAAAMAPEINAGFAATGLTLLLGGVAVLRSRRSRSNS